MDANEGMKNLHDVVNSFDVAMLVTHSADGMHARPMAIASKDEGMDAYLVTDIKSLKIDEMFANPQALLTFQGSAKFASVRGELSVVHDRHLIETMWKEAWKVWFPLGKTDPDIAVLKFTAREGEYWDNAGLQGLKYAYDAAKAYVTGVTPKPDDKRHASVHL